MQHIAVFGSAQGIHWRLNHIHSMKYSEVISASIAANSAGIDYLYIGKLWLQGILLVYSACNIKGTAWRHAIYHRYYTLP